MLSTAYNVAALLVLLAGGYFIDRFGTKKAIFVFAVICLFAAALTALTPRFEVILAGRFLLGLGAEPLIVAAILYWILERRAEGRIDLGAPPETDKLEFKRLYAFSHS